jgi:hypothetical protein
LTPFPIGNSIKGIDVKKLSKYTSSWIMVWTTSTCSRGKICFFFSVFFQHPNIVKVLKSKNSQGRSKKQFFWVKKPEKQWRSEAIPIGGV